MPLNKETKPNLMMTEDTCEEKKTEKKQNL